MKLHQIIFSPSGGTKRVCEYIAANIKSEFNNGESVNLCEKAEQIKLPDIKEDDLAIIAVPVFGGRIPSLAKERLGKVKSNHARCVIVAVYGNRAYDDALTELQDVAKELGFSVIAAVSAVAEHSVIRKYGNGRPDAEDKLTLQEFGSKIVDKIRSGNDSQPTVPGNRPYKKAMAGPNPKANKNCTECGVCAKECPVEAISAADLRNVDKNKCISCMRCVAICPSHARGIGKIMNFLVSAMLKKPCATRKDNELFI